MSEATASLQINSVDKDINLTKGCASVKTKSKKRALEESTSTSGEAATNAAPDKTEKAGAETSDCNSSAKKARTEKSLKSPSVFGSSTGFTGFTAAANPTNSSAPSMFGSAASIEDTSIDQSDGQKTSIFGSSSTSANSIFGTKSKTSSTGFGKNAISSTGFGSQTQTSSGFFGSSSSSGKLFTKTEKVDTNAGGEIEKKDINQPSAPSIALLNPDEPIKNGEENENTIITLRSKLFKLTKSVPKEEKQKESNEKTKRFGIQMATKVGRDEKDDSDSCVTDDKSTDKSTSTSSKSNIAVMDWKEVGIGPLRVLSNEKSARIVQRRESTPGGQGTKLILNIALRDECSVEKKGDKFVRLAAFEILENTGNEKQLEEDTEDKLDDGKNGDIDVVKFAPVQYLFKVKTIGEADLLFSTLKQFCEKK